ncbi:MAG TPA: hypothetical protein PKV92_07825 [Thermodesulfovibrio thiophilus]|nr:hypothetical protein [Thermodesulfovibrio thiophilus]HQD36986.1 hypothetical protein [Thermodesulfovibrio thiophilus]
MIKCNNECPLGKFDGCCHSCPEIEGCKDACESNPNTCGEATFDEETGLVAFKEQQISVLQQIADLITTKKKLEEQEKELKDKLKEAMEKFNIKKFDSDILKITYIAETTATSIDSAKLKKKYPAIAEECSKTSKKSAYIKVEIKDET